MTKIDPKLDQVFQETFNNWNGDRSSSHLKQAIVLAEALGMSEKDLNKYFLQLYQSNRGFSTLLQKKALGIQYLVSDVYVDSDTTIEARLDYNYPMGVVVNTKVYDISEREAVGFVENILNEQLEDTEYTSLDVYSAFDIDGGFYVEGYITLDYKVLL